MEKSLQDKRYVVVLAHADGWGTGSANKVVKAIHDRYPEVGIHLIVSQATRDKEGRIATKIDDLRASRELKETNLLKYFKCIDERYDEMEAAKKTVIQVHQSGGNLPPGMSDADRMEYMYQLGRQQASHKPAKELTLKQLGKRYCEDGEVHYTDRGGFKGGEQVWAWSRRWKRNMARPRSTALRGYDGDSSPATSRALPVFQYPSRPAGYD